MISIVGNDRSTCQRSRVSAGKENVKIIRTKVIVIFYKRRARVEVPTSEAIAGELSHKEMNLGSC